MYDDYVRATTHDDDEKYENDGVKATAMTIIIILIWLWRQNGHGDKAKDDEDNTAIVLSLTNVRV